jgi:hypothetical protein
MASEIGITLSIKDPSDGREIIKLANETLAPVDPKATFEIYKEIYKEALNNYRYFGTLRGAIAWPPALILGGVLTYFGQNPGFKKIPHGEWLLPVVFLIVLLLIVFANYYLQRQQAKCMAVAKASQKEWVEGVKTNAVTPKAYSDFEGAVVIRKIPDWPSAFLVLFAACLFGLNILVTLYSASP